MTTCTKELLSMFVKIGFPAPLQSSVRDGREQR